jgi:hypothetical protein
MITVVLIVEHGKTTCLLVTQPAEVVIIRIHHHYCQSITATVLSDQYSLRSSISLGDIKRKYHLFSY